jgi:hypothetical protein
VHTSLQQSLFCEHWVPVLAHGPPELPLLPPLLVTVTVTVMHADSHEVKRHCSYWWKTFTPSGYLESQAQSGDGVGDPEPDTLTPAHELAHSAYARQSLLSKQPRSDPQQELARHCAHRDGVPSEVA